MLVMVMMMVTVTGVMVMVNGDDGDAVGDGNIDWMVMLMGMVNGDDVIGKGFKGSIYLPLLSNYDEKVTGSGN